jgi:hypothetical protein
MTKNNNLRGMENKNGNKNCGKTILAKLFIMFRRHWLPQSLQPALPGLPCSTTDVPGNALIAFGQPEKLNFKQFKLQLMKKKREK